MKPVGEMSQAELGAYVQSHLRAAGIEVILSGGAAVAIYTSGKYVSRDLDFVNQYLAKRAAIREVMEQLGFQEVDRHFMHPDTDFFVEFPPGPLAFGDEQVTEAHELSCETGVLRLITPTDCVKDRLAWYYHFGDRQCLAQAILVSRDHKVNLREIRRWSEAAGKRLEFERIRPELSP